MVVVAAEYIAPAGCVALVVYEVPYADPEGMLPYDLLAEAIALL